jgi:hypothetical protein
MEQRQKYPKEAASAVLRVLFVFYCVFDSTDLFRRCPAVDTSLDKKKYPKRTVISPPIHCEHSNLSGNEMDLYWELEFVVWFSQL